MVDMRAPGSDFGSWRVEESLDAPRSPRKGRTHDGSYPVAIIKERKSMLEGRPPSGQRPASATVRVPYMPSHVVGARLRPKLRPRSAAPSYMRATFAVNSAMPTFARPTSNHVRHRPGYVLRPGSSEEVTANGAAKYVLEEGFHQGNRMCSPVGHPWWQGFGVRTATGGNDGSDGGKEGVQQKARRQTRRPASAPVRFFGRRPATSPGYMSPAAHVRGGGFVAREKTRPGKALGRPSKLRHEHDYRIPDHHFDQKSASPMRPAAWGASCTSAATTHARTAPVRYDEAIISQGSPRVTEGSVLRQQQSAATALKSCGPRHQAAESVRSGRRDHSKRMKNDGDKWVGLLKRSNTPQKGDDAARGRSIGGSLSLAICPSPWGAFLGGPRMTKTTADGSKKRPSSAPRRSLNAHTLADGADHARARPRSAYAASPSRHTGVLKTKGYVEGDGSGGRRADGKIVGGSGGDHKAIQQAPAAEELTRKFASKKSLELTPSVNAVSRGDHRRKAQRPMQDGTKSLKERPLDVPDAEIIVVTEQVEPSPGGSPLSKGECKNGVRYKMGMPVAPAFWPRVAPGTTLSASPSPSRSLVPPSTIPRNTLGLFGSALVPGGTGAEPPQDWKKRREPPLQGSNNSTGRLDCALLAFDPRISGGAAGGAAEAAPIQGRYGHADMGFVGRALPVPKRYPEKKSVVGGRQRRRTRIRLCRFPDGQGFI